MCLNAHVCERSLCYFTHLLQDTWYPFNYKSLQDTGGSRDRVVREGSVRRIGRKKTLVFWAEGQLEIVPGAKDYLEIFHVFFGFFPVVDNRWLVFVTWSLIMVKNGLSQLRRKKWRHRRVELKPICVEFL